MDKVKVLEIKQSVFASNDREADAVRHALKEKGVFLLNLMSSPGSGKTTTLRRTIEALKDELRIGVMEADIASDEALDHLGSLLVAIAECDTPAQAAEAAWNYQHELALVSGNRILALIYYSFKAPVITLWTRFCRLYGIEALCRNTEKLYDLIRARDHEGAARWVDEYLGQAISGSQQIYSE